MNRKQLQDKLFEISSDMNNAMAGLDAISKERFDNKDLQTDLNNLFQEQRYAQDFVDLITCVAMNLEDSMYEDETGEENV